MSPKTMSPTERAKRLVDTSKHMTIATVDVDGVPWVSPVFYVADDNYNLYWVSGRTARHSENIRRCPKTTIAIVIFEADPVVDAVYMSTEAEELTNRDEVDRAIQVLVLVLVFGAK